MTTGARTTVPKRGDAVLIPFPFAELTASKARPVLVVSGEEFLRAEGKIMVAAITSKVHAHVGPTNLRLARWKEAGLLRPSVITSWLATLSPGLVLMRIGALSGDQMRSVEAAIRAALAL